MNDKIKFLLSIITILIILFLTVLISEKGYLINNKNDEEILFVVNQGDSADVIINNLFNLEIIDDKDKAKDYAVENELIFYNNEYSLNQAMSIKEVMDILASPISNTTNKNSRLVIIEGDVALNIANNIEQATNYRIKSETMIALWNDHVFLKELINKYWFLTDEILNQELLYPLEGYLTPASFTLSGTITSKEITYTILDATSQMLGEYQEELNNSEYSIHQIVALASIIERETATTLDKPLVSGVFYNRLNTNMLLQSDITVLYALQEHSAFVSYEDLKVDSPYNTYIYLGIPIGAVASPSKESLDAALNPKASDNLYFFALQDTGEVIYSETYEEHQKIATENAWEF